MSESDQSIDAPIVALLGTSSNYIYNDVSEAV